MSNQPVIEKFLRFELLEKNEQNRIYRLLEVD